MVNFANTMAEYKITADQLPDKAKRKINSYNEVIRGDNLVKNKWLGKNPDKTEADYVMSEKTKTKLDDLNEDINDILFDYLEDKNMENHQKTEADIQAEKEAEEKVKLAEAEAEAKEKAEKEAKEKSTSHLSSFGCFND